MQNPMIENLVRFTHLEKLYGYLPGMDEALMARLFGLDETAYREVKDNFNTNVRRAARELLEDPAFAGRVDRLPFRAGETVLGIGDSFTDGAGSTATSAPSRESTTCLRGRSTSRRASPVPIRLSCDRWRRRAEDPSPGRALRRRL